MICEAFHDSGANAWFGEGRAMEDSRKLRILRAHDKILPNGDFTEFYVA